MLQKVGPIEHLDLHEWDRVLNINVRANVILMKHFIPTLRAAGGGSIVTVSSWYGKSGHGLFSAYCASKAALISLTHSAAAELASDKIRVNSVAPGNVATDMHFKALREEADKRSVTFEEMKDTEWNKIPLGRAAEPVGNRVGNCVPDLVRWRLPHGRHDRRQRRVHVHVTRSTRKQSQADFSAYARSI